MIIFLTQLPEGWSYSCVSPFLVYSLPVSGGREQIVSCVIMAALVLLLYLVVPLLASLLSSLHLLFHGQLHTRHIFLPIHLVCVQARLALEQLLDPVQ